MKNIRKKITLNTLSVVCTMCLGLFSVFRYTGFSLCLFGEPEFKE